MSNIKLIRRSQIRGVWNEADEKWLFVICDLVSVLTDKPNPPNYINKKNKRDFNLSEGGNKL